MVGDGGSGRSKRIDAWTTGLVCVSIVAGGVIVGGFLHDPEPELTTAPPTTTTIAPQPEPEHTYRTPPVVYPTEIPGCETVDPPGDDQAFGWMSVDAFGYDNPEFPWFSARKAMAMSTALREALPDGVVVGFGPLEDSLLFGPIVAGPEGTSFGDFTDARATVWRGENAGSLWVTVRQSAEPIPPCVAGVLDERRTLADGTVVDTHDTWSEVDGVRTLSRHAVVYLPDGSVVGANADDRPGDEQPTGTVPLTVEELVALATLPELRVSAPVPPGTPDAPEKCSLSVDDAPEIEEAAARRLNEALARVPVSGLVFDHPLGDLRPTVFSGGLCQSVRVGVEGQQSRLTVTVATGQELPSDSASSSPEDRKTVRRSADGSVLETEESRSSVVRESGTATSNIRRTVTVTHPSGTRIRVSSDAEGPVEPVAMEQLEAIATAPGLEVS
ncbi:hypothetical protein IU433_26990 [Nocardia puris]|uniref:Uncharacterized protein n=2 Tax=Nocardia puris TaxID=208602 RepID=A0A366DJT6_9NOCA|nr:hypothetical protein [Nocardia puris]MBF6368030.1 hypothetical protein [Nocardia puris]MBF6462663.1 hypothetical protein [Nocardia puris]RBO90286.1 hypothetical protein DFR74_106171 [Nocardia puris]